MLLLAVIIVGSSCTVIEEEAIQFSPESFSLEGSMWALKDCPHDPFLIINGYNDCDYLANLEFQDGMVYITYDGTDRAVPHYICKMSGNSLMVSIQDCSNTTWRPTFQWDVVEMNNSSMAVDVRIPAIMSSYVARFEYERIN